MLETVDLKKKLSKSAYATRIARLQNNLAQLQYAGSHAGLSVVVCLEGWNASGRGRVIRKLTEKLDPRLFRVHASLPPTAFEQGHSFLWRYQIALPDYGEMVVFDHSWYRRVLDDRCDKTVKKKQWREAYEQINQFERWLTDDGQVVLKFWMHISKKEQKKRFREYLRDPLQRWKVTRAYRRQHRRYDRWVKAVDQMLAETSTPNAPWKVIEANDLRWARVRIFETLVAATEEALARRKALPVGVSGSVASWKRTSSRRPARRRRAARRGRRSKAADA